MMSNVKNNFFFIPQSSEIHHHKHSPCSVPCGCKSRWFKVGLFSWHRMEEEFMMEDMD